MAKPFNPGGIVMAKGTMKPIVRHRLYFSHTQDYLTATIGETPPPSDSELEVTVASEGSLTDAVEELLSRMPERVYNAFANVILHAEGALR